MIPHTRLSLSVKGGEPCRDVINCKGETKGELDETGPVS